MALLPLVAPGIFIPKFEPVKWKATGLTQEYLNKVADELAEDAMKYYAMKYYGKWQFVQTTYRLEGDVWVPDDKLNFVPYPNTPFEVRVRHGTNGKFKVVNPNWTSA